MIKLQRKRIPSKIEIGDQVEQMKDIALAYNA